MADRGFKRQFFRSRGERILALVPKPTLESEEENEDEEKKNDENGSPDEFTTLLQVEERGSPLEDEVDHLLEYIDSLQEENYEDISGVRDLLDFVNEPPNAANQEGTIDEDASIDCNVSLDQLLLDQLSPPLPDGQRCSSPTQVTAKCNKPRKPQRIRKLGKIRKRNYHWKKTTKFDWEVTLPASTNTNSPSGKSPLQYFLDIFDEELVDHIVYQSNLYQFQQKGQAGKLTKDKLLDFLAIEIIMGVVKMPSYLDYWSMELGYDKIKNIMPRNEYAHIRRYLHFNDNNLSNKDDRFYKVRPVLDSIKKNCNKLPPLVEKYSIDEMMIPYKGKKAGFLKQYIKSKPKKWGFKFFVRSGINGLIHDFLPYEGEATYSKLGIEKSEENFPKSAKLVLALTNTIKNKALSVVYFDNFFSNVDLMVYLREQYGILSLATIRQNRLVGVDFSSDASFSKKERGAYECCVSNKYKILVAKWNDNRPVHLASTYVGINGADPIERYSKTTRKKELVACPQIVKQYNTHMGGVDLSDMYISLYRTSYKCRKWYMTIFFQLLDICLVNSFILYKQHEDEKITLKKFRLRVAQCLQNENRRKKGRPSSSNSQNLPKPKRKVLKPQTEASVRKDRLDHFPGFAKRARCKVCSATTIVCCTKCEVNLCFVPNKKNCFSDYHF